MIGFLSNLQAKRSGRGQSILEFALTLPVLLVILAGVLEVGNLLVTYNRVQVAAREASRFGAAGGGDASIKDIVSQASIDSLDTSPDRMSVYVVRPKVEYVSGSFQWADWSEDCVYGDCVGGSGLDPNQILNEVTQIQSVNVGSATASDVQELNNTRVTIVSVYYEAQTILNLNFWDTGADAQGRVPLRAYTITRQEIEQEVIGQQAAGCSAFPIAINSSALSGLSDGDDFTVYNNGDLNYDGFEFLGWQASDGEAELAAALIFPGTSSSYVEPGSSPIDDTLHRGDRVARSGMTEPSASVETALNYLIDPNIFDSEPWYTLRVIVFSEDPGYVGPVFAYTISNFAIVQVRQVSGPDLNTITFRFKRLDSSCGIDVEIETGP